MALPGATLRYIVYDLLRDFKQAFSEASISEYQLTYWVLVHADRMKKQHIQKLDSGEYIHIFDVEIEADSSKDDRRYLPMPARVYDFDLDKGIAFINYYPTDDNTPTDIITFSRTTAATIRLLYFRGEETPSLTNPYFYRVNDKLYLLGVDALTYPTALEVGLYSTLDPTDLTLDIDQDFDFPQDLIPVLKRQVLDMGLWVLNVPSDLVNDGANIKEDVPQKKFTSVNDFNQDQS